MWKTEKELRKINTPKLLKYYKAERKRFYGVGYWCGCGCGLMIWEAYPRFHVDMEEKYMKHNQYLNLII